MPYVVVLNIIVVNPCRCHGAMATIVVVVALAPPLVTSIAIPVVIAVTVKVSIVIVSATNIAANHDE